MLKEILTLQYPKTKLAILALLTLNIFIYAVVDSLISAVDALAWVILLIMYELEASKILESFPDATIHSIRNAMIAVIVLIFFYYIYDNEWLDVLNTLLWLGLIVLMELEIRFPESINRQKQLFSFATIGVFLSLVWVALAWLWRSSWLDAYDAALWITAFALIEVDIFKFLQIKRS